MADNKLMEEAMNCLKYSDFELVLKIAAAKSVLKLHRVDISQVEKDSDDLSQEFVDGFNQFKKDNADLLDVIGTIVNKLMKDDKKED